MLTDQSQVKYKAYQCHGVFELIDHMIAFYEGLWDTSYSFVPNGTMTVGNYSSNIYLSIRGTLNGIRTLLKEGYIADAFVLIRKLFDTVLVEIYLNVVREDQFDWMESLVVPDVDEWLRHQKRIPNVDKILNALKKSETTKDLYPWFGWDSYLKNNRMLLDSHVHTNSYYSILLNCPEICLSDREKQLNNAAIILKEIMLVHISFTFYMNGPYMMASDYMDYCDMNMTPLEGSECWLASYAQNAFDEFIKPHVGLASFIKEHCVMDIK